MSEDRSRYTPAPAPGEPPTDTGDLLTPAEAWKAWRGLKAQGCVVVSWECETFEDKMKRGTTIFEIQHPSRPSVRAHDMDPLIAFTKAYRAWQTGPQGAGEEQGA